MNKRKHLSFTRKNRDKVIQEMKEKLKEIDALKEKAKGIDDLKIAYKKIMIKISGLEKRIQKVEPCDDYEGIGRGWGDVGP